jgi:hypothetical protein
MKLTKLMLAMIGGVALTFIAVRLTFAAPAAGYVASNYAAFDPTITPTATLTHTHPVVAAIALYFKVPYVQVLALHDSGLGYGEIARVFMTAGALNDRLTFEEVLALRESGLGWGEIAKQYGVRLGGNGLGAITRGRAKSVPGSPTGVPDTDNAPGLGNGNSNEAPNCSGNSCNAPGKNKPGKSPKK